MDPMGNEQVDLEISQSLVEAQLPTRDLFGRVCVNLHVSTIPNDPKERSPQINKMKGPDGYGFNFRPEIADLWVSHDHVNKYLVLAGQFSLFEFSSNHLSDLISD